MKIAKILIADDRNNWTTIKKFRTKMGKDKICLYPCIILMSMKWSSESNQFTDTPSRMVRIPLKRLFKQIDHCHRTSPAMCHKRYRFPWKFKPHLPHSTINYFHDPICGSLW